MKISKIVIKNVLGITHQELDGKSVILKGGNGVGKTSVIDSIKFALKNQTDRKYLIKNGEDSANIIIETDTGLKIDRTKNNNKSDSLKLTQNGKALGSPQTILNDIFTDLQINPIDFVSWSEKEQNRAILSTIPFEWDLEWIRSQFGEIPSDIDYSQHILKVLHDIQSEKSPYWIARADANKKELFKRQQVEDISTKFPVGYNAEHWANYDLVEKSKELQQIQYENAQIEQNQAVLNQYQNNLNGLAARFEIEINAETQAIEAEKNSNIATIERLKAELKAAEDKLLTFDAKLFDKKEIVRQKFAAEKAELKATVASAEKYQDREKTDVSKLQAEVNEATKMKEYVSEYREMLNMKKECAELTAISEKYNDLINLARELPAKILETAQIPVKGLTVVNGLPLINGLPISNLSDGQKIELCVDITLQQEKKLELILLNGIEALDESAQNRIFDKCKNAGVQIIGAKTTNDELQIIEL